jgi:hypothetical protein
MSLPLPEVEELHATAEEASATRATRATVAVFTGIISG